MNDAHRPAEEGQRIPPPGTMAYAQWKRRQELLGQKPETRQTGKPVSQLANQQASQQALQPGGREANPPASQPASQPAGVEPGTMASILTRQLRPLAEEVPIRKLTFLVTSDEAEILEELKLQLRRRFQLKATKNDILRAAIRLIAKDFARSQETSFLARKLRGK